MNALSMIGADAETRAALRKQLGDIAAWTTREEEADGVVVLLRSREDWTLWNRTDRAVAGVAFDRRYADGDGGEGVPIFYAEELDRLTFFLMNDRFVYASLAAAKEHCEYDGCLW